MVLEHKGVYLKKRNLKHSAYFYARWIDPTTKKEKTHRFPQEWTPAQRTDWALRKSKQLEEDTDSKTIQERVEETLIMIRGSVKERTIETYADDWRLFGYWAKEANLVDPLDISTPILERFRFWLRRRPKLSPVKGGIKGKKKLGKELPSAVTVNRRLRQVRHLLTQWRRLGYLNINSDDIKDSLRGFRTATKQPEFLRLKEIPIVLNAARAYDNEDIERQSIFPFILFCLLSGLRRGEALALRWEDIDFDAKPSGILYLDPKRTKMKQARIVDLSVSPMLRKLLARLQAQEGGGPFTSIHKDTIDTARTRLLRSKCPHFTYQMLRATCATFLTNAPGIFGAASAYRSAKQLGHSVTVAERHYTGLVYVEPDAKTLEDAMDITDLLR